MRRLVKLNLIMGIFLMGIFLMSFSSAFEFDNRKYEKDTTFDGKLISNNQLLQKYRPIEIKNSFGLGKTLIEGYISKHTETCGTECSSTIEIKLGEKGELIEDIYTKKLLTNGKWIKEDKELNVKLKTGEYNILVKDYENKCIEIGKHQNGTIKQKCSDVEVGTHIETKEIWVNVDFEKEYEVGRYKIKIEAKKQRSETIDWIIKTNGFWLDEWAVWNGENLTVGLKSYWDFDSGTDNETNIYDRQGNVNSIDFSHEIDVDSSYGVLGNGSNWEGNDCFWFGDEYDEDGQNRTYSFWLKTNQSKRTHIISKYGGGGNGYYITGSFGSTGGMSHGYPNVYTNGAVLNDSEWHHTVIVLGTAGNKIYVDGEINGTSTEALENEDIVRYFSLGCECNTDLCEGRNNYFTGQLDEIGIWNRSLSQDEITELYNNGNGLAYPFEDTIKNLDCWFDPLYQEEGIRNVWCNLTNSSSEPILNANISHSTYDTNDWYSTGLMENKGWFIGYQNIPNAYNKSDINFTIKGNRIINSVKRAQIKYGSFTYPFEHLNQNFSILLKAGQNATALRVQVCNSTYANWIMGHTPIDLVRTANYDGCQLAGIINKSQTTINYYNWTWAEIDITSAYNNMTSTQTGVQDYSIHLSSYDNSSIDPVGWSFPSDYLPPSHNQTLEAFSLNFSDYNSADNFFYPYDEVHSQATAWATGNVLNVSTTITFDPITKYPIFDSNDDFLIPLNYDSWESIGGTNTSFTTCQFFKRSETGTGLRRLQKWDDATGSGALGFYIIGNDIRFWEREEVESGCGYRRVQTTGDVVADTNWHHVCGVVDRENEELRLILDGEKVASRSISGYCSLREPIDIVFGRDVEDGGSDNGFRGQIAQITLHNDSHQPSEILEGINRAWWSIATDGQITENVYAIGELINPTTYSWTSEPVNTPIAFTKIYNMNNGSAKMTYNSTNKLYHSTYYTNKAVFLTSQGEAGVNFTTLFQTGTTTTTAYRFAKASSDATCSVSIRWDDPFKNKGVGDLSITTFLTDSATPLTKRNLYFCEPNYSTIDDCDVYTGKEGNIQWTWENEGTATVICEVQNDYMTNPFNMTATIEVDNSFVGCGEQPYLLLELAVLFMALTVMIFSVGLAVMSPKIKNIIVLFFSFLVMATPSFTPFSSNPLDGAVTENESVVLGWDINESDLKEVKFSWNGTNTTIFDDSVVLMYNFDNRSALGENDTLVYDISGNGNNGTVTGGANASWTSDGKYNGAFEFNRGIKGYIRIKDDLSLNLSLNLSIGAWIKTPYNLGGTSQRYAIAGRDGDGLGSGFLFGIEGFSSQEHLEFRVNGDDSHRIYKDYDFLPDVWYFVSITYSGNNANLYVNGINIGSDGNNLENINTPYERNLTIGATNVKSIFSHGSWRFNGTIDDLTIWNRSLTAEEISQLYKSSLTKYNSTLWKFSSNQTMFPKTTSVSYDYYLCAKDFTDNENCTIESSITITPKNENISGKYSHFLYDIVDNFHGVGTHSSFASTDLVYYTDDCSTTRNSNYQDSRQKLLESGIKIIRMDMNLQNRFPVDETFSGGARDREIVEWAYNNNLKILYIADYTPIWLSNTTDGYCDENIGYGNITCNPINNTKWAEISYEALRNFTNNWTYLGAIEGVQIRNEPYGMFWLNNLSTDHQTKADLYWINYNDSYHYWKTQNQNIKIIGASTNSYGQPNMANTFLSNVSKNTDGVSFNWYISPSNNFGSLLNATNWYEDKCNLYGANCSKIYITETNLIWNTGDSHTDIHYVGLGSQIIDILNNYGNKTHLMTFKWETQQKNLSCDGYNGDYAIYSEFDSLNSKARDTIKNFATLCPPNAEVYESSSTDETLKTVSCKVGDSYSIIVINTDTKPKDLTIQTSSEVELLFDYETGVGYFDNSLDEFYVGGIEGYGIRYFQSGELVECGEQPYLLLELAVLFMALTVMIFSVGLAVMSPKIKNIIKLFLKNFTGKNLNIKKMKRTFKPTRLQQNAINLKIKRQKVREILRTHKQKLNKEKTKKRLSKMNAHQLVKNA